MPAAFEKLTKILKLEQSLGYRDRAVIGGLEKFAETWQNEVQATTQDQEQKRRVAEIADRLKQYAAAAYDQRVEMVHGILDQLEQTGDSAPASHRPPPHKPGSSPDVVPVASMPPQAPRPTRPERPATGLDAPVTTLPGISTAFASRLKRLDIETVGDLLYHFPHRYQDYSTLKPINRLVYGEETTIIGVIWETHSRTTRSGSTIVTSVIADASGTIEAVWFNQPFLANQLRAGRRIVLSGRIDEYLGRLRMQSPEWEPVERELIHTGRLVPIYSLTRGISARWMRRLMKRVVDHWAPRLDDHLPETVRQRAGLMDLTTALRQIHFPDDEQAAGQARRRLTFDEFLLIQLRLLQQRQQWQEQEGQPIARNQALLDAFLRSLPFQLTTAQENSLQQILQDMDQAQPMSRLLQGDVGSGKTVIAAAAMLTAIAAGKQAALMAPTEILAEQHYHSLADLLAGSAEWGIEQPISVVLLTGSLSRVDRRRAYTAIASGEANIVVGTQALVQRHVTFQDLGLVVVDEQHRFGVMQRTALRKKGMTPHMLVMSATPIPRSLALTIYGDLEISTIGELPPGRQPIETRWLQPAQRERAYAFLRSQIAKGRQAFILYPLIEESNKVEARAAVDEYERLQKEIFSDLRVALLHGRMKPKEKDAVMASFRQGEIDILVSTSVIEVGIDVPNATVMLIEGADRFGLAQLHQFRGRVGRGAHQSYCLLLSDAASPDDPQTKTTWERLRAIEETQDGFALAEKDLEIRGPGDFFGVRQSGLPTLRLASLSDIQVLEQARSEAVNIFQEDPGLNQPQDQMLAEKVVRFWQNQGDLS
jgi:ATP-dependent DNA helicase RecG